MKTDPLAHLEERPGIYMITNTVTGERYIGQAINLKQRCKAHRGVMQKGTTLSFNSNPGLLRACKKHGLEAFVFTALEYADLPPRPHDDVQWMGTAKNVLSRLEARYQQTLLPEYNTKIAPVADGVGCSVLLDKKTVEAIRLTGMRQPDFIRLAVLEKLQAMSLLEQ